MSADASPERALLFDHAGALLAFTARRLLIAGYTGRDPAAVEAHIAELEREGVPRPERVPWVFVANPELLQTALPPTPVGDVDCAVWAYDDKSSGEAEYALLIDRDGVFVAIGSDHTDRGLERASIERSKQLYPRTLSAQAWRLDELLPRWDGLRLRSWAVDGGERAPYQDGTLAQLIRPEALLDLAGASGEPGTVVFSGTLPVLGGRVRSASRFEAELSDADGRALASLGYDVRLLPPHSQPG